MVVLRNVEALGRAMRVEDDLSELGQSTLGKLRAAISDGKTELALELADYLHLEDKRMHDIFTDWISVDLAWIAHNCGEDAVPTALRNMRQTMDASFYSKYTSEMSFLEAVKGYAEIMRGHGCGPKEEGDFEMWEESDRFVMKFDPCGSGLRMVRGPLDGSGSRFAPPYNFGKTTKPYPWSWGKANVPYYCAHCCIFNETIPIEQQGYPFRITEFPADDPSKPCYWYYYKNPNLIPEEYFERVGFKKDPSKFRRRSGRKS